MQIIGTVRGEGRETDGLERLYIYIDKKEAKVLPYQEGGKIKISLIIEEDCYESFLMTTKTYVYLPVYVYVGDKKIWLAKILKDKNIEKNQKVTLEIKDGHIRLIPMRNTHLPPTNFKLPIMVEPSQTIIQNSVSHYEQSKESPVIHLSNYGKPVKNLDNITVSERKNVINNSFYLRLWNKIRAQLDIGIRNWQERIISFGQVTAAENREQGKRWTDNEIFEGVVKAILSSNTDWVKIERTLPELPSLFHNFELKYYASLNEADIKNKIHPWFVAQVADSQSLKLNLIRLIKTSEELIGYSQKYGCLDNFINALLKENNFDPKLLVLQFGSTGGRYKLSGMRIPIASEALRNIGFDIAKPDRHINRALGCFGMVKFKRWSESYIDAEGKKKERYVVIDNPEGYSRPESNEEKCLEVMRTMEEFAKSIKVRPVFLDNAIWLLCAKSDLYMKNEGLMNLARAYR